MSEQLTREEQHLVARFRAINALPLGSEPAGARERIRMAGTRNRWPSPGLFRALSTAVAVTAVVVVGVLLGRGLLEVRSNVVASQDPSVLRSLGLPEGLSAVRLQLAPDGRFLALVDSRFERVQLLEIEVRAGRVSLRERAALAGSIVDIRWREDAQALLVKVAGDRVRDQVVSLYELRPSGTSSEIATGIAKDAVMAAAIGRDEVAVASGCCPSILRVFSGGATTLVAQAQGLTLLGWSSSGELLYAHDGSVHFWTPQATSSVALPGRSASLSVLSWSADRRSVVIVTGERRPEAYALITAHEVTPLSGAVPTGLWTPENAPLLLDDQSLNAFDVRTGTRRTIAQLSAAPRVLWGVAGSSLLWSSQDSADVRVLDLENGRERVLSARGPITAVLLAPTSPRFVVLPARGEAQLGQP